MKWSISLDFLRIFSGTLLMVMDEKCLRTESSRSLLMEERTGLGLLLLWLRDILSNISTATMFQDYQLKTREQLDLSAVKLHANCLIITLINSYLSIMQKVRCMILNKS